MNGSYLLKLQKLLKDDELSYKMFNDASLNNYPDKMIKNYQHIRTVSKPLYYQKGGAKKIMQVDGKDFYVNLDVHTREEGEDTYNMYYNNFDAPDFPCAILQIDSKKKTVLIHGVSNFKYCVICDDKDFKFKIGDILMKIMLQTCVKKGIKKVELSDNSRIACKGTNDNFNLSKLRIMTEGEPYYTKYGFIPVNKYDQQNLIENKNLFNNLVLNKKNKIKIINIKKNLNYKNKNMTNKLIESINKRNDNYKLSSLIKAMFEIYCNILLLIYQKIYSDFGFQPINKKLYYKNI